MRQYIFSHYHWVWLLLLFISFPVAAFGQGESRSASALMVDQSVGIRAQLTPQYKTILSSELSARIKKLTVNEGDHFNKGQELVVFDCTIQNAQHQKSLAILKAAQQRLNVNRRLIKLKSIGLLEVNLAEAGVKKAQAEVAIREAIINQCVIHAPFDGGVVERLIHNHQYIKAGTPIMEILNERKLEMELIVPSHWLVWLNQGQSFTVHIDENQKSYPSTVHRIGVQVDPVSQSVKIIGRISGVFPELLPGMSGNIVFPPIADALTHRDS